MGNFINFFFFLENEFEVQNFGTNSMGVLPTVKECIEVAGYLQKPYAGSTHRLQYPLGCFVTDSHTYFNEHQVGTGSLLVQQILKSSKIHIF